MQKNNFIIIFILIVSFLFTQSCANIKGHCGVPKKSVTLISDDNVFITNSVWAALKLAVDGDSVVFNGIFTERQTCISYNSSPMTKARNKLSIIGIGNSLINVVITNKHNVNECAMDLSKIDNLYISNLNLRIQHNESNNGGTYGLWLNSCKNAVVDNSTIQSEIYGSNNIEKTYVAINNASNIVLNNSTIISVDMTGLNKVFHTATHDAKPTTFNNCVFLAGENTKYNVGKVIFHNCKGNITQKSIKSISDLSEVNIKNKLLGSIEEKNKVYNKITH